MVIRWLFNMVICWLFSGLTAGVPAAGGSEEASHSAAGAPYEEARP